MKDLKIFAKTVEGEARNQIDTLLAQDAFKDCKVRIMPDVHAGAGCVIGFTANLGDKVIPNIVGVDIGCGMYIVNLGKIDIDYAHLDAVIREHIPAGMTVRETPLVYQNWGTLGELRCYDDIKNNDYLYRSLGTLGGGNHFIEIDVDDEDNKYLVIHTGSRNLGKQVADIYQRKAIDNFYNKPAIAERQELIDTLKAQGREKEIAAALQTFKASHPTIPKELCYLEGQQRNDYLHDMRLCQRFATENREYIASIIGRHMGWLNCMWKSNAFHTVHNYISDDNMVRKGAISAQEGEPLLIPMNMRDGCLLGVGLGNAEWNYSAPHGAGRLMSRSKARETISLQEYADTMHGVFTTSVTTATIDEAPQAYKPFEEIVECVQDTIRIDKVLLPTYNFKAGD